MLGRDDAALWVHQPKYDDAALRCQITVIM